MAYTEDVNVNLNVLAGTMGGITAIMGGMSALTSSFGAMGTEAANSFGTLDALLVTATAMMASFGLEAANAYGEFEQGMKIVQTVSGQTNAAISQLTNQANQMSVAYRTSIGDITDGLQTLGRAGLNSVNEQIEVLESGLQTAKLEGRNLNGVLEEIIQNTAMLGGDLKSTNFGEQAEYLNSLMVGTSMTAPIDSHDISQTLQYAGGTAAAAGANLENKDKLEDLMGTVAAFAQKGVKGSMAGTALRAFFTKPASQDESVTNALSTIGLSPENLWEDGGESMKSVSDQVGIIQRRMEALNMSTMDQVELWGKIVGPKMGQQMMKLDSATIKDITRDIQNAKSAEELSAQTLYTYTQKLSQMQQQGEVAFRGIGEKAVVFLNPVVDVINAILGLLSNPVINTTAFATMGSLMAHGFRKAWGMITTVWGQMKGLINDAIAGIQSINSLAGGSVSGFTQSASQVDFLNQKLIETNAELQAIQAKALGIKPGYIAPAGLPTDKIQPGTLRIYEEDVVRDKAGVLSMKGYSGSIYPGQYADEYGKNIKKEIAGLEKDVESRKIATEEKIAAINQRKLRATEVADEMHLARVKEAEAIAARWKQTGFDPIAQKEMLNDHQYKTLVKQYGSVGNIPRDMLKTWVHDPYLHDSEMRNMNPDKWLSEQKSLSATERRSYLSGVLGGYDEKIKDLKASEDASVGTLNERKKILKDLEKTGATKVQTRLQMMTEKQFNQWYKGLDESDPTQAYSKMRTDEMFKKNASLIGKYEKQGYLPAFITQDAPKSHPNNEILRQAENQGYIQSYIDADKARIEQQKALWAGETTYTNRARNLATQRMNAWGNAVSKGTQAITGMPSRISGAIQQMRANARDPGQYLKTNASMINQQAGALNLQKLNMSGMSAAQALDTVARELGLTRTELSMLMADEENLRRVNNLEAQEKAQLINATRLLKEKIIEATMTENMDEEASRSHAVVMKEDIAAVSQHAIATKANATTMGGIRGTISGLGSSMRGAVSSVVGIMGGPFMAAMMGATVAMQAIQHIQQQWQEQVQDASNQLSEAKDKMSQASENLTALYQSENNSITDADLEKITDTQYASVQEAFDGYGKNTKFSDMYNNEVIQVKNLSWTQEERDEYKVKTAEELAKLNENTNTLSLAQEENIDALKENTIAVADAAHEYASALQKNANVFDNGLLGFAGLSSDASDAKGTDFDVGGLDKGIIPQIQKWMNLSNNGFLDNMSPVLTASQSSKDYMAGTDLASIYLADSFRFDFQDGLERFFGNDYDLIIGLMGGIDNKMKVNGAYGERMNPMALLTGYSNAIKGIPESDVSTMLMFMKDNPDDMSKLGKQMFRQEQQYDFKPGITAYANYGDIQRGIHPDGTRKVTAQNPTGNRIVGKGTGGKIATLGRKDIKSLVSEVGKKKLTVQDRNLKTTIDKFRAMTGNKLSEQQILLMGNLQQLSDMNKVAQDQIAPGVLNTVQQAAQMVGIGNTTANYTSMAASGAGGAADNAYAIAVFLQADAIEKSKHMGFETYRNDPNAPNKYGAIGDMLGIKGTYNEDEFDQQLADPNSEIYKKYGHDIIRTAALSRIMLQSPELSYDTQLQRAEWAANKVQASKDKNGNPVSTLAMLQTVTKGMPEILQKQIMSAYDQSKIGEYGGDSGAGGGSGGGSGSGSGKDKGTGSTKSRVDLVLCNRKTIPKLNVNLFKKPPNFTIKNKQFNIRDIKINTEDKPDAMVDAVKDGIIRTQKRMDPKIIQDENAVYDPMAATDGTTPKGKTPVGTTTR